MTDAELRRLISERVPTIFKVGVGEAPICIVVCASPKEEPYHFVEDAAAATQNMALAAHSLGLASCWIGIYDQEGGKGSAEESVRRILEIPKGYRVISILPIGNYKQDKRGQRVFRKERSRKEHSRLVHHEKFQNPE